MVCSKVGSHDQMNNMNDDTNGDNFGRSRVIDILTPEGKTLKMHIQDSTTVGCIKIDCELLCGIPSDLQLVKLQDKELGNDETIDISDGCTLRVTVQQWWQKFISACYKGDTKQVRKRALVKMSQISREERNFTAAFIGAVKGNHNLMFATCAGRNMNLRTKTKLSGRNLLHAAVSGGSKSCVANIFMNGGNALLEVPDNTGETPIKMAEKLYGDSGELVNFLNVYLELHRRDAKCSGSSNSFWDNFERNNDSSGGISADDKFDNSDNSRPQFNENMDSQLGDLSSDSDERTEEKKTTNYTETRFCNNNSATPLTKVNIVDYDATVGQNSSHVRLDGFSNSDNEQIGANFKNEGSSEQCYIPKSDTGYYSGNNESIRKDTTHVTEMLWNEHLFTQANTPLVGSTTGHELSLAHSRSGDDKEVNSMSLLSADPNYADSNESDRRAQPRNQGIEEQRRKRTTTERPNLEKLLSMSSENSASPILSASPENEPHNSESVVNESRDDQQANEENKNEPQDKQCCANTESEVVNARNDKATLPTATSSEKCNIVTSHSPKPLRRAQLRKKSIVEQQRRRRSMAGRPNLEELIRKREEESEQENASEIGKEEGSGAMDSNETGPVALVITTEDSSNLKCKEKSNDADFKDEGLITIKNMEKENTGYESKEKKFSAIDYQGEESPVSARYVLQMWQNQALENASGDETDTTCSPKTPRRALLRKQVFMEQRRKRSATERPNLIKRLDSHKKDDDGDEKLGHEEIEIIRHGKGQEKTNKDSKNNDLVFPVDRGGALESDFSSANSGESASTKEQNVEPKKAPTNPPLTGTSQKRLPIRVTHRRSNVGHLLEARARKDLRSNWSYLSGDESDVSETEQKVVDETVMNIRTSSKMQRRRRLPMVPNKTMKLPLIKIEDSGTSTGSDPGDTHVPKCSQVHYSGSVGGDEKSFVLNDNFKVPCPSVGRSRSGSMCSEDSASSEEMLGERSRQVKYFELTIVYC